MSIIFEMLVAFLVAFTVLRSFSQLKIYEQITSDLDLIKKHLGITDDEENEEI